MDKHKLLRVIERNAKYWVKQAQEIKTREDYIEVFGISRDLNQTIINLAKLHWMHLPREIYQASIEIEEKLWEVVVWELIN